MAILLSLSLIAVLLTTTAHKLAILQEKDYWRGRVLADPRVITPKKLDIFFIILAVCLLSAEIIEHQLEQLILTFSLLITLVILGYELSTIFRRQFKRPKLTLRILLVASFSVSLCGIVFALSNFYPVSLLVLNAFNIWIVLIGNELARHIVYIGHRRAMRQAAGSLYSIPGIKVIGITGSYGKSTTKEFLNTILNESHSTISTPGSVNTDIGLAVSLNKQFSQLSKTERDKLRFAVLEMDAYVIGTIARVTKYFPLDMAMLTAINEQHLDTFGGDIRNTMTGNYQIFEGITRPGSSMKKIGVFNFANQYCRELAERFNRELNGTVYSYGDEGDNLDAMVSSVRTIVSPGAESISFTLKFSERLGGESISLTLPVPGEFNALNYAGAALMAKVLGLNTNDIKQAAQKLTIKSRTLKLGLSGNGVELIDDSFNANPASVRANIDILRKRNDTLPTYNIVVFTGLFDLGPEAEKIHSEIGLSLAQTADKIYLTNPLWGAQIVSHIPAESRHKFTILSDPDAVIKSLEEVVNKNTEIGGKPSIRIMVINRIPAAIYNYIKAIP